MYTSVEGFSEVRTHFEKLVFRINNRWHTRRVCGREIGLIGNKFGNDYRAEWWSPVTKTLRNKLKNVA